MARLFSRALLCKNVTINTSCSVMRDGYCARLLGNDGSCSCNDMLEKISKRVLLSRSCFLTLQYISLALRPSLLFQPPCFLISLCAPADPEIRHLENHVMPATPNTKRASSAAQSIRLSTSGSSTTNCRNLRTKSSLIRS